MFAISYTDPTGRPCRVRLPPGRTVIGRAPHSDVVVAAPSVSRQHARLTVTDGRCLLADAGSRHGIIVGGVPLVGEMEVRPGSSFTCGSVTFSVDTEAGAILSERHHRLRDAHTIVRSQERFVRLLTEMGKTLITAGPASHILARVVDLVFDAVPAERTFLLRRDAPDEAMTARVARRRDGRSLADASISRSVVTQVMRDKVSMLATDVMDDARISPGGSIHQMNVRSFLCAPLWNRGDVIGVLYADNPHSKRFSAEDLDVFTALANYAAVAIEQARVNQELLAETRRRERLQRYHSPGVVNQILCGGTAEAGLEAREVDLSVMFCDLCGFTSRTEHLSPTAVAALLNHYFATMSESIFEVDGTLDKFIGDAILAVFGAPFEQPDHADRAVQAALAMRRALETLNPSLDGGPLQMRTSINSGRALTGDIGSPRRREFTVLGDVVNCAARMEKLAGPGQIVISAATRERLRGHYAIAALGAQRLRGREASIELFEVLDT